MPPAISDEAVASSEDDDISLPSSSSPSPAASPEPDASSSDDGPDTKKPRAPQKRMWPSADEVTLLEVVAAHRERHCRLPSPSDLVAALRGRGLQVDTEQAARRVHCLRVRYDESARRLSRGVVPVKDDDLKIFRLSKLIWEGTRKGKMKPRASHAHHERRGFRELAGLYPCLAAEVEAIEARRPCGTAGVLKRAFERIGDEKATELEAKAKKQRRAQVNVSTQQAELRNKVAKVLNVEITPSESRKSIPLTEYM